MLNGNMNILSKSTYPEISYSTSHSFSPLFKKAVLETEELPPIIGLPEGARLEGTFGYVLGAAIRNTVSNISTSIQSAYRRIFANVSNILFTSKELLPYSQTRHRIEIGIDSANGTEVYEACHANDAAQIICSKHLDAILNNNESLTTRDLSQLEVLIASGVVFNQYFLHKKAIRTQDSSLVDMISNLKISSISTGTYDNAEEFYRQLLTNPAYEVFATKFSQACSDPFLIQTMEDMLAHHYEKIMTEIQKAKKEYPEKPLLILIGEVHFDINSVLSESIALHIARKELNIDVLHSEAFSSVAYQKVYNKIFPHLKLLEELIDKLGLHFQPIDISACVTENNTLEEPICHEYDSSEFLNTLSPVSPEGMIFRNKAMVKELVTRNVNKDAIAIVGADHLIGMIQDERLQNHFNVVAISTSPEVSLSDPELLLEKQFKLVLEKYFDTYHSFFNDQPFILPMMDGLYLTFEQYNQLVQNIVESRNTVTTECKTFEPFNKAEKYPVELFYKWLSENSIYFLVFLIFAIISARKSKPKNKHKISD